MYVYIQCIQYMSKEHTDNIHHFHVCLDEYPTTRVSIQPCKIVIHSNIYADFGDGALDLYCRRLKGRSLTEQLSDQMVGVIVMWIGDYAVMRQSESKSFFMTSLKYCFSFLKPFNTL